MPQKIYDYSGYLKFWDGPGTGPRKSIKNPAFRGLKRVSVFAGGLGVDSLLEFGLLRAGQT
jgi:hypothetical protein